MTTLHDPDAELAVLGTALVRPAVLGELAQFLSPSDFHSPDNRTLYESALTLHDRGDPIDAMVVGRAASNDRRIHTRAVEVVARAVTHGSAVALAQRLVELSTRRQLTIACEEVASRLEGGEAIDRVLDDLSAVVNTAGMVMGPPVELETFEQFADRDGADAEWVVPHLFRRQNRVMIIAPAGLGKATMIRQICWAVSQGLHPFDKTRIDPQPTMLIDAENPTEAINEINRPMIRHTKAMKLGKTEPATILHRPEGMDLRSRRDRGVVEQLLATHRPAVVGIGPLYKLTRRRQDETAEEAAIEFTTIIDDWRVRFDCAFLIEHHSPRGENILPFGSSVYERWPELGIVLKPHMDPLRREVSRFRGDRIKVEWPDTLEIPGDGWPYVGRYARR